MKQVSFETINNKKIFSIFTEPENSQKKVVIMSHGFRGSSIGPARSFVNFEKLLIDSDISVLRFDQPNSSNSEGNYVDSSFNEWVNTTSYFAKKFLNEDYEIALLGQSMGASTSVIASTRLELIDNIKCLLLWVPDPKSTFDKDPKRVEEESGQKYRNSFWKEARDSDFFGCLKKFSNNIHLVYGESDKYIPQELKNKVIETIKTMGQQVMILEGQDHSSWEYNIAQKVYQEEITMVKQSFNL